MTRISIALAAAIGAMACVSSGAFLGAEGRVVWKPCGSPERFFHWDTMEMSPDPAVLGSKMAVTITGKTEQEMAGGAIDISIRYYGAPIYSEVKDLCDLTQCPLHAQQIVRLVDSEMLPSFAFAGAYEATVNMTGIGNQKADILSCMVVTVNIVRPFAEAEGIVAHDTATVEDE